MELMQRKLRYSAKVSFNLYHLCYYFSKSGRYDEDKQLILAFKNGKEPAIRHFIVKALEFLEFHEMDKELIIVRTLHNDETIVHAERPTPLDRLGWSLATVFDCFYSPDAIQKRRITRPIKSLAVEQRIEELRGVYSIETKHNDFNDKKVLIIDDVVTTGATMCAVISAILKAYPLAKIDVFSLAWTPAPNQQIYIQEQINKRAILNEPIGQYGLPVREWVDEDFLSYRTNISFYSE